MYISDEAWEENKRLRVEQEKALFRRRELLKAAVFLLKEWGDVNTIGLIAKIEDELGEQGIEYAESF